MSRIGKRILNIESGTEISVNGSVVTVKGKLGELSKDLGSDVQINIQDNTVSFELKNEKKAPMWGTVASIVDNMLKGVNEKFAKTLLVEGVGYKAEVKGDKLVMSLGFSHPVLMEIPSDLDVTAEKNTITVSGIDKEKVGLFASRARLAKKPEPYKGKGVRYQGEVIRKKEGKKGV